MLKEYNENEPYIFVSYSHKNEEVKTIIECLQKLHYRIWYDDDINGGSEWDENIAEHIYKSQLFWAFVSEQYILSSNCRDELKYALTLEKNIQIIYLEYVDLSKGLKMRLDRIQALYRNNYDDTEFFIKKLCQSQGVDECIAEYKTNIIEAKETNSTNVLGENGIDNMLKSRHNARKYKVMLHNATEKIREMCEKKAKEIYGNPIPCSVLDRLETELGVICGNVEYASYYLIASELAKFSFDKGYPVTVRGMLSSSLITFLCGISEVNPLPPHYYCPQCHYYEQVKKGTDVYRLCGYDIPNRKCPLCSSNMKKDGIDALPEINMGISGDLEPDIAINFAPKIRSEIIDYIKIKYYNEYFIIRAGTKRKRKDGTINRGIHPGGIFIVPRGVDFTHSFALREDISNDDFKLLVTEEDFRTIEKLFKKIDILEQNELGIIHDLQEETGFHYKNIQMGDKDVLNVFSDYSNGFMIRYLKRFQKHYREQLKIMVPNSFSDLAKIDGFMRGTHNELLSSDVFLEDTITCRDDIIQYLMMKGVKKEDAYFIMKKTGRGEKVSSEMIRIMEKAGISKRYIDSCNVGRYLYPWSHCVEYVRVNWMLAYYWLNYPKIYEKILDKQYSLD